MQSRRLKVTSMQIKAGVVPIKGPTEVPLMAIACWVSPLGSLPEGAGSVNGSGGEEAGDPQCSGAQPVMALCQCGSSEAGSIVQLLQT